MTFSPNAGCILLSVFPQNAFSLIFIHIFPQLFVICIVYVEVSLLLLLFYVYVYKRQYQKSLMIKILLFERIPTIYMFIKRTNYIESNLNY